MKTESYGILLPFKPHLVYSYKILDKQLVLDASKFLI